MTYKERLPAKKELDPLIAWSCEITRQIKTIILIDKIKKLIPANAMFMNTKLSGTATNLEELLHKVTRPFEQVVL